MSLHPLPKIDEMYAKLKDAKVFSNIDLRSGYYHIALGKDSRAKTAFVMPFGKYEFLMAPFGLAQVPVYFQLLMIQVLEGLNFAMTYLDDIIIFSNSEEEHLIHLEEVFHWLREAGLKMKRSKCDFFQKPDSLLRTSNFQERHQPPTGQVGQHQEHASAEMHERDKTVLRSNWLL